MRLSRRTTTNIALGVCALVVISVGATWGTARLLAKPEGSIGSTHTLRPGPWGQIIAQPILVEAPADLLSVDFRLGDGRWYFRARTPDEVAVLLRTSGLNAEQIGRILSKLQPVPDHEGLLASSPPAELVRSLTMPVRSALYDKLALVPENFAQAEPFRISDIHLDAWLNTKVIPRSLVAEVKSLMWRRGSGLFFSDYNLVADKISSQAIKLELIKQLTRKSSVILTLRVPSGGTIDNLADYYGTNGRRDKVEPLLRALGQAGGGPLGLSDLLPRFARARLYHFPEPLPGKDSSPDCHWTTFNFFSRGDPDNALNDPAYVVKTLQEKYEAVGGTPRFGDVVLLTLPDGSAIHSATYIADNIVFTKNGPSLAAPYLFSTIEDMLAFYPSNERIRLAYYRLKNT